MAVRVHWFQKEPDLNEWEYQFSGLSTDEKPQDERIAINSLFWELDTGDFYYCKSPFVKGAGMETLANGTISEWEEQNGAYFAWFVGIPSNLPDNIVVVWDGTEYQCAKTFHEGANYYYYGTCVFVADPDFSAYPFSLFDDGGWLFVCNVDATHTIEIKAEVADTPAVWEKVGAGGNTPTGELLYEGTLSDGETIGNGYLYELNDVALNYSSIIVEYNGTQYTVNNFSEVEGIYIFGATTDGAPFNFSEYPFNCRYAGGDEFSSFASQDENPTIKIWANSDPIEFDEPAGPHTPDIG